MRVPLRCVAQSSDALDMIFAATLLLVVVATAGQFLRAVPLGSIRLLRSE